MNALVFGAFAILAAWRLFAGALSVRSVLQAAVLVAVAGLGYAYAARGRLSRAWGILAFLVSWYWIPAAGVVALWTLARMKRGEHEGRVRGAAPRAASTPPPNSEGTRMPGMKIEGGLGAESLALLLQAGAEYEAAGASIEYGVTFTSPFGDHIVPLLVTPREAERAVYVDANPWTAATEERCLRWLGLLRNSDREDLEVEIRGAHEVPERLRYYSALRPRVLFEVAAIPQVKWVEEPGFAEENETLLRRLAIEWVDVQLGEGIAGLEELDRLVVGVLREDDRGHILPWTVFMLGSFFGEALVSLYGGRWKVQGERVGDVTVEIEAEGGGAVLQANVFGKVMKLFDNGMEDSTAWMARGIGERLDESRSRVPRGE